MSGYDFQIRDWREFHPRAVKLLEKRKNFIVIAEDEPYFIFVYDLIRMHETANGTWSDEDECAFRKAAQQSVYPTRGSVAPKSRSKNNKGSAKPARG